MDRSDSRESAELCDGVNYHRVRLIKLEVETGLVFASLARTYRFIGALVSGQRAFGHAKVAYDMVKKLLPEAQLTEHAKQTVEESLRQLNQDIEQLSFRQSC
jgi:hypothetical protein